MESTERVGSPSLRFRLPSVSWTGLLVGSLAVLSMGCGSNATAPGPVDDAGVANDSNSSQADGAPSVGEVGAGGGVGSCSFSTTGQRITSMAPCEVSVATGISTTDVATRLSFSSGDDIVPVVLVVTLSNQTEFHTGLYDATNVVKVEGLTLGRDLAGWGVYYNSEDSPNQGSFSLTVRSIGTPFESAITGRSGTAAWVDPHGTLQLTMTPLNERASGEVMLQATF